jgi:hypothetical protein
MALTRLDRHQPFAAMGKPLELDGGERIGRQQAVRQQNNSDEQLLHIHTPIFCLKARYMERRRLRKDAADCQY